MTIINNEHITKLMIIARLAVEGVIDNGYNSLSKEDKAFVDSYVEGKKIRQQLDNNKLFNNRTNDNKFYVC